MARWNRVTKFMKLWRNWEVETFWFPLIKKSERRKGDKQTKKTVCRHWRTATNTHCAFCIYRNVQSSIILSTTLTELFHLSFCILTLDLSELNKVLSYHQILRSLHPCLFYIVRSHLDTQTCLLEDGSLKQVEPKNSSMTDLYVTKSSLAGVHLSLRFLKAAYLI